MQKLYKVKFADGRTAVMTSEQISALKKRIAEYQRQQRQQQRTQARQQAQPQRQFLKIKGKEYY